MRKRKPAHTDVWTGKADALLVVRELTFGNVLDELAEVGVDVIDFAVEDIGVHAAEVIFAQVAGPEQVIDSFGITGEGIFSAAPPVVVVPKDAVDAEIAVAIVLTAALGVIHVDLFLVEAEGLGEGFLDQLLRAEGLFGQFRKFADEHDLFRGQTHNVHGGSSS